MVMLPGPRGCLLLSVVVAEVGLISMGLTSVAKPCGNLMTFLFDESLPGNLSFGVWENLWTSIILAAALVFSLLSSYRLLERQQVLICGLLAFGTIVATLIVRPDVGRLLSGAIRFGHMPAAPAWRRGRSTRLHPESDYGVRIRRRWPERISCLFELGQHERRGH